MKCKNCGADYRARELKCPYCDTGNLIGRIWMAQRSQAELEYERTRRQIGRKGSVYIVNRVVNRTLVVGAALFLLYFIGIFAFFGIQAAFSSWNKQANIGEIQKTMDAYYADGEYGKLYDCMHQYDMFGEEQYVYSQAVLLAREYENYMNHKLCFLAMDSGRQMEDDYHLEYALRDSIDVYMMHVGIYSEPDDRNREQINTYQNEIMAFWRGTLGMTEEELAHITSADGYIKSDEIDVLIRRIKERRAWQ